MVSMALLTQRLRLDDSVVAIVASTSECLANVVYAFAARPWHLYMGPIVEIFAGSSTIAVRSMASKLVGSDERGKVNSLLGVAQSLLPVLYVPVYVRVYAATLDSLPGAFFLLGGVLTLPALAIYV